MKGLRIFPDDIKLITSLGEQDICVLNAEERFLVHLRELHHAFPRLRIVLEHATTKAAVDMVRIETGDRAAARKY
jgi:dihydroorotase